MTTPATSLYAATAKLQPRMAHGRYARLRVAAMLGLLGLYYLLPWISLGGQPLVLLDLPHRRFHVLGLTLMPQDLYLLAWLLVIAAMTLFLFTALAGRLWCGYACPQTVWTEAFLWMERLVEGERHARLKLDAAPWGANKILRRGGRHLLWALFSLFTGLTFVAYFVPARELFPAFFTGAVGGWALFWSLFYGFATWGNAGFLREQVCKYMCPYARFQSSMFDRHTLLIAYDEKRGEPRKSLARKADAQARGSCVDCSLCVQVCPTGIDIRQGLQYECIACAACVDVCDNVMDSVGQPRGLIRYTSSAREEGLATKLLRPRTLAYGLLWLLLCGGFVVMVALRSPLQLDVMRDRHSLYRQLPDGRVENLYTVKLANASADAHRFRIEVRDRQGRAYEADSGEITLAPGELRSLVLPVRTAERPAETVTTLLFTAAAVDAPRLRREREARFLSGAQP
ncbi:cytochrome c oxidase accessory protein CcoG [Solimonas sp. SE-A11]|uniref:cytochrome c oxidase accessory protein CcoG n=1 Tax=Solimonas sp. SE-A11 TaxID=3054954 RepID=UPI00259CE37B|nr:cytochrome c oxidase accessory protein CcoG [Solimonas sp. SE-A11]MDM4769124.1 cytochrome c oxidase accessory protein CcoG [Solimonas sp. SE-A11]